MGKLWLMFIALRTLAAGDRTSQTLHFLPGWKSNPQYHSPVDSYKIGLFKVSTQSETSAGPAIPKQTCGGLLSAARGSHDLESEHGAYLAVEASFSISKEKHGEHFRGEFPLFLPRHSSFGGFPIVFPMVFPQSSVSWSQAATLCPAAMPKDTSCRFKVPVYSKYI